MQKIMTSDNCLQFPEIPAKFREIFTEKSAISIDVAIILGKINFEKLCNNQRILQESKDLEIGAVQKSANVVDLENIIADKCIFGCKNRLRYSCKRAL